MSATRCAIHGEDGHVIADSAEVSLEITEHDGVFAWYGTVTFTDVQRLAAGERYRMVLEDGRSGEIFIQRKSFIGTEDRSISFRGNGPLE